VIALLTRHGSGRACEIDGCARDAARTARLPARRRARARQSKAAPCALRTAESDDIRAAIALLEEQTDVDAQAPVESRNRGVETAKKAVRKAVFFTTNHLTEQLRALGWATTSVAEAAAERIEALEARVRELEDQVARLEGDRRPPAS
jgi:hypothetical protein